MCPPGERLWDLLPVCVSVDQYSRGVLHTVERTHPLVYDAEPVPVEAAVGSEPTRFLDQPRWPATWQCDAHACRTSEFGVQYTTHRRDLVVNDTASTVLLTAEVDVLCPKRTHRFLRNAQNGGAVASSGTTAAYQQCVGCADWCGANGQCADSAAFLRGDMRGTCLCSRGFSGYRCEVKDLHADAVIDRARYIDTRGPEGVFAAHTASDLFSGMLSQAYPAYDAGRSCSPSSNTWCDTNEWCYVNVTASRVAGGVRGSCFCIPHAVPVVGASSGCAVLADTLTVHFGTVVGDEASVTSDATFMRETWSSVADVPRFAGYIMAASIGTGDMYALARRARLASTANVQDPASPDPCLSRLANELDARLSTRGAIGSLRRAANTTWLVGAHHSPSTLSLRGSDGMALRMDAALVACNAPFDTSQLYAGSPFTTPPSMRLPPSSVLGRGIANGPWSWCAYDCTDVCGGSDRADCSADGRRQLMDTGACACKPGFSGPLCTDCSNPRLVPPACARTQVQCGAEECGNNGICATDRRNTTWGASTRSVSLFDNQAMRSTAKCLCMYPSRGATCNESRITCGITHCGGHGTCSGDASPSPTCECSPGYIGQHCLVAQAWCNSMLCSGHGVCSRDDLACTCDPGREGDKCERTPCTNGGTWNAEYGACGCPAGYTGSRCETHVCGTYTATDVAVVPGTAGRRNGRVPPSALRAQTSQSKFTGSSVIQDPRMRLPDAPLSGGSVAIPKGTWVDDVVGCACDSPWTRHATGTPVNEYTPAPSATDPYPQCVGHRCGHGDPVVSSSGVSRCKCHAGYRELTAAERIPDSTSQFLCVRVLQWITV